MADKLLEIPEYDSITQRLRCQENCDYYGDDCYPSCYFIHNGDNINSRYDCMKFTSLVSIIKTICTIIVILAVGVYSFMQSIATKSIVIIPVVVTIIILVLCDFLSEFFILKICKFSEKRRKEKYDEMVAKIKEDNEAMRWADKGITEEMKEFFKNVKDIFNDLTEVFNSLKSYNELESKEGKRVLKKSKAVISELETLNDKLSKSNYQSSYISTLYNIHLPKLVEYSRRFTNILDSKNITQNQVIEFAKLLEVFRDKIANHTEYLKQKDEDDFIIKVTALNEDVNPDFDGSEVDSDED